MAEYNSSYTGLQIDDAVGKALAALPVDNTLSTTGKAADAKKTGDEISDLKSAVNAVTIIDSASGAIASFADGADGMQIRKIIGTIVPQQSGSGDPSPTNIRDISGLTQANITASPTTTAEDGATLTINWQTEAGTIYGGTVTLNEDGSADVVSEYGIFTSNSSSGWAYANGGFVHNNAMSTVGLTSEDGKFICNKYISTYSINTSDNVPARADLTFFNQKNKVENRKRLWIKDSTLNGDLSALNTALAANPLQVVYPLTTTQSYHFANIGQLYTYFGTNNVWIDTGAITECDYPADTKLYIDGLTEPDEDMIADGLIASGKYFTVNNQLYLSTAQIAAGAQIIPGSNCTATSITEALNALNS